MSHLVKFRGKALYHGTRLSVLKKILREGIQPAGQTAQGATQFYHDPYDMLGMVGLTTKFKAPRSSKPCAVSYGAYAVLSHQLRSGKSLRERPKDEPVVLEIDPACLDPALLGRRKGSDERSSEFDYHAPIPPSAIRRWWLGKMHRRKTVEDFYWTYCQNPNPRHIPCR